MSRTRDLAANAARQSSFFMMCGGGRVDQIVRSNILEQPPFWSTLNSRGIPHKGKPALGTSFTEL